jgi:DNA polymerase-3 subunit alpha
MICNRQKFHPCEPWPLIVQLDREKEVTGMFLSGHPLDHFKFEMKHYNVSSIADFNEFKEAITLHSNPNRPFRLIALVAEAQHKISKNGNKYGNFIIEDYSGKATIILFTEDYLRFTPFLQQGTNSLYNRVISNNDTIRDDFDFKVNGVSLVETMKRNMTRQLSIDIHPSMLSPDMIQVCGKKY